jgi:hypothetical protein
MCALNELAHVRDLKRVHLDELLERRRQRPKERRDGGRQLWQQCTASARSQRHARTRRRTESVRWIILTPGVRQAAHVCASRSEPEPPEGHEGVRVAAMASPATLAHLRRGTRTSGRVCARTAARGASACTRRPHAGCASPSAHAGEPERDRRNSRTGRGWHVSGASTQHAVDVAQKGCRRGAAALRACGHCGERLVAAKRRGRAALGAWLVVSSRADFRNIGTSSEMQSGERDEAEARQTEGDGGESDPTRASSAP